MLMGIFKVGFEHVIKIDSTSEYSRNWTYTGYSALCFVWRHAENGQLHTIDIKEELVDFQRKHFDKSWCKIVQHLGGGWHNPNDWLKVWFGFIDADKEKLLELFWIDLPKMNKGGIISQCFMERKVLEPLNPKIWVILLE
jgi:hypothetical protein